MLPKKGSRKITVEGRQYLWRASAWDEYTSHVVLCPEDSPGRPATLSVHVRKDVVLPVNVEAIIMAALEDGWNPDGGSCTRRVYPDRYKMIGEPAIISSFNRYCEDNHNECYTITCVMVGAHPRDREFGITVRWNQGLRMWQWRGPWPVIDTLEEAQEFLSTAASTKECVIREES